MAPDSNTRTGCVPLRPTRAGILGLGLAATKPLPNCWPSPMRISQASYSAPLWPRGLSGNSRSCVAPTIGRLMLAKRPPLSLFQVQMAGGV